MAAIKTKFEVIGFNELFGTKLCDNDQCENFWSEKDKKTYKKIREKIDRVVDSSGGDIGRWSTDVEEDFQPPFEKHFLHFLEHVVTEGRNPDCNCFLVSSIRTSEDCQFIVILTGRSKEDIVGAFRS